MKEVASVHEDLMVYLEKESSEIQEMFTTGTSSVLSHFSHVQLFATLWTVVRQTPLSMGFSRLEYGSGLP